MKLHPLKSANELLKEYDSRTTLRVPFAIAILAASVAFWAFAIGVWNYSMNGIVDGYDAYPTAGPHSDMGDNEP